MARTLLQIAHRDQDILDESDTPRPFHLNPDLGAMLGHYLPVAEPHQAPPVLHSAGYTWRYDMRREAQVIIPGVMIGPYQSANNLAKMKAMGITHVLCVRDKRETSFIYPRYPDDIKYHVVDVEDQYNYNILSVMPAALKFIDEARLQGGTVLAHCHGGMSLSPAFVIGYLMAKFDWPFEKSHSYVQSKRFCVGLGGLAHPLAQFEPIQMANQMLAGYSPSNHVKRALADADESYPMLGVKRRHSDVTIEETIYEI